MNGGVIRKAGDDFEEGAGVGEGDCIDDSGYSKTTMMHFVKIADIISEKISGEWGDEPRDGSSVRVLRTTNFTNRGKLNLASVVERLIDERLVEKKKLQFGDTIIEKSGGSPNQPVGRVVYFDVTDNQTYLCNNFTAILRPINSVFPKYFFYALFHKHLGKATLRYQNKTTGILNLQVDRYLQEEIPLPPLSIQKQIAAILEKADAAREKRRQANQLTEQFLQSAFLEMFGDPGINTRRLPAKRLADLVRKDDKINYGVVQPGDDYPGGVPIVRIGDFDGLRVDKANLKRIDPNIEAGYKRSRLVGDEVLLACVGSIGMVTLADPSLKGFNTVRAVARIRCGENLDRLFLAFYLSTSFSQSFFSRETRTVSQPTLNIRQIEETQILVPPLANQQKFAALVEKVEGLRGKQRESEKELENLFQSLMQRAFKGEL